jgi:uncharacterized protein (DUF1499 family)
MLWRATIGQTMTSSPNTSAANRRAQIGAALARLAFAVGLVCGAAALLGGPGYRMELLSLSAGIQTIRWAATIAVAGAVLALVAAALLWGSSARRALLPLAALVINLLVAGPPLYMYREAQRLPHIHDVSTDTEHPPQFVAVLPLRKGAPNPVDYKPETAKQQKAGYPEIAPLMLDLAPAQAFERAERAARAMGWDIVAVAPQDLRIEATDTTLLFGFKDDVVIRVTPQARGSVIDVRSLSRVGGSDLGVNAKRVLAFMRKLSAV